jgi:hypothetical protein
MDTRGAHSINHEQTESVVNPCWDIHCKLRAIAGRRRWSVQAWATPQSEEIRLFDAKVGS